MKTREQIAEISRSKKRFTVSIIAAAVLLVAIVTSIIVASVWGGDKGGTVSNNSSGNVEILEGEGMYIGIATAYPSIKGDDISRITVKNNAENGNHYTLMRSEDMADGDFLFAYYEDGEIKVFMPSICEEDATHKYSDLYAAESGDGYGVLTKVDYLVAALEHPYFKHRIEVSSVPAEREKIYREFGFESDKAVKVEFDYKAADGSTATHKIVIGERVPVGVGYYFMVDDRPYIYNSTVNYFDYALGGFYSFVNTTLIAKGLEQDSTYEPLFTSNFTHWENTVHKDGKVKEGADVIFTSMALTPVSPSDYTESPGSFNGMEEGYRKSNYGKNIFELLGSSKDSLFRGALLGKEVGTFYDYNDPTANVADAIHLTFVSEFHISKNIEFSKDTMSYCYEILEVEAIIDGYDDIIKGDARERVTLPTDKIKVAYRFTVNGKHTTELISHAVLDLANPHLPADAAAQLSGVALGALHTPVEFSINYTEDNAKRTPYEIEVTEIVAIYDSNNKTLSKVDETAIVGYKYYINVNGKNDGVEYFAIAYLSDARSESEIALRDALVGRKVSNKLSIKIAAGEVYSEVLDHFTTYVISSVDYFVTREERISFSFLNASERDPFYGDSIYKNNTDGYELYGLNATNCEQIAKLLGGALGENTTVSEGLFGSEVVDVGITPDKMEKYGREGSEGLFAHTVYFEIPRGIEALPGAGEDELDDYTAYDKIGFTLYISDLLPDGTRYIASELYDIVSKIDNEIFFFLDERFVDFWAKENIILTDVETMLEMKFEFNMEDLVGDYTLDINHKINDVYQTSSGQLQIGGTPPYQGAKPIITDHDFITVNVTPSGDCTENALTKYLAANNKSTASLEELYKSTTPKDKWHEYFPDSYGTTYFKEFVRKIFYMTYEGAEYDKNLQDEIVATKERIMKFSLMIDSDEDGSKDGEIYYSYDFYRYSERRVLVRIYREEVDSEGNITEIDGSVSDFYISVQSFKALAGTYLALLNGESFELED